MPYGIIGLQWVNQDMTATIKNSLYGMRTVHYVRLKQSNLTCLTLSYSCWACNNIYMMSTSLSHLVIFMLGLWQHLHDVHILVSPCHIHAWPATTSTWCPHPCLTLSYSCWACDNIYMMSTSLSHLVIFLLGLRQHLHDVHILVSPCHIHAGPATTSTWCPHPCLTLSHSCWACDNIYMMSTSLSHLVIFMLGLRQHLHDVHILVSPCHTHAGPATTSTWCPHPCLTLSYSCWACDNIYMMSTSLSHLVILMLGLRQHLHDVHILVSPCHTHAGPATTSAWCPHPCLTLSYSCWACDNIYMMSTSLSHLVIFMLGLWQHLHDVHILVSPCHIHAGPATTSTWCPHPCLTLSYSCWACDNICMMSTSLSHLVIFMLGLQHLHDVHILVSPCHTHAGPATTSAWCLHPCLTLSYSFWACDKTCMMSTSLSHLVILMLGLRQHLHDVHILVSPCHTYAGPATTSVWCPHPCLTLSYSCWACDNIYMMSTSLSHLVILMLGLRQHLHDVHILVSPCHIPAGPATTSTWCPHSCHIPAGSATTSAWCPHPCLTLSYSCWACDNICMMSTFLALPIAGIRSSMLSLSEARRWRVSFFSWAWTATCTRLQNKYWHVINSLASGRS